jgi:ParB family chromosome partitioning protein
MASKKKGLGKGLDALLGDAFSAASEVRKVLADADKAIVNSSAPNVIAAGAKAVIPPAELNQKGDVTPVSSPRSSNADSAERGNLVPPQSSSKDRLFDVPVENCRRGQYQPRRDIDPETLEELASSIKSQGIMQPIVIRPLTLKDSNDQYEIIAGERRWRAAQLLGMPTVPAVVKAVSDEAAIVMALVENLQREDLNPMEEAYALSRLQEEFELTHQQVAEVVGKSRAAISNMLRLMSLQGDVKRMLENGDLEMGHARALLPLEESRQLDAAKQVADQGLSVRQTEALVRNIQTPKSKSKKPTLEIDPNIRRLQDDLSEKLGVPVQFKHSDKGAGSFTLKYNSLDELDGILEHIK